MSKDARSDLSYCETGGTALLMNARPGFLKLCDFVEFLFHSARFRLHPQFCAGTSNRHRILIIDEHLPDPKKGAGYPRARDLLRAISNNAWQVDLFPLQAGRLEKARCQSSLLPARIVGRVREDVTTYLVANQHLYNAILVSRPRSMELVRPIIQTLDRSRLSVIYDAEAIFAERTLARCRLHGEKCTVGYEDELSTELSLASLADIIISVSGRDARVFESVCESVYVISNTSEAEYNSNGPSLRKDILFVGRLEGCSSASPNVDSIVWFVRHVMPLLDNLIGQDYVLNIVGLVHSEEVKVLASNRVVVLGVVKDIRPIYDGSRLFIAPTRFAAGVPQKVVEAAAVGIPCVVTPLLLAQLGFANGKEVLAEETPEAFAEACAKLMTNDEVWSSIRESAFATFRARFSKQVFSENVTSMLERALN